MKTDDNGYFRLHSECYLVQGVVKGAIYNLFSGDIFTLEAYEQKILEACEANEPVKEISQISGTSEKDVYDFLLQLEENHLGMFFPGPFFMEKYIDRTILGTRQFWREPPRLQTGFIELSNQCNLDCFFCSQGQVIRRWPCMGCSRSPLAGKEPITEKDYLVVLNQLNKLKCRNLILRGGNPLCEADKFRAVVKKARTLDFNEIFVVTNGVDISPEMVQFFEEQSLHPVIQVFSQKAEEFDSITGKVGSFDKLNASLNQLNKHNIRFSFTALFPHADKEQMKETMDYYRTFSPVRMARDHLLPLSSPNKFGSQIDMIKKEFYYQNRELPRTSVKDFFDKKQFNPCLNGKIAITVTGDVLPCPEMPNDILGNIETTSIYDLFAEEAFDVFWKLGKETIGKCQRCQYRYSCSDCRALETKATGDLHGMKYCAYDPEQGKWQEW